MRFGVYILAMGGMLFTLGVAVMLLCFGAAWLWRKLF